VLIGCGDDAQPGRAIEIFHQFCRHLKPPFWILIYLCYFKKVMGVAVLKKIGDSSGRPDPQVIEFAAWPGINGLVFTGCLMDTIPVL
jgi:hypothetical protein